jgi:LmbE family N-acetylglucosaminyl deacetylase
MNATPTLLFTLAHPDDECFGTGGTIAHYAAQGVHVALVCATRGEVGEISDPSLATPETLPQVREAELRCAAAALGINELIFLDYRDSGMAGTPENQHPAAFMNIPAAEVVPRLVGLIRRLRPQAIVTFEPHGGYGHPDHIAIHHHTVAAFHAAGDPTLYPDQGAPWQPDRLFYTVVPRTLFQEMRDQMLAHGLDTTDFDRWMEDETLWVYDQIDLVMDIAPFIEPKWAAFACHRTQFGQEDPFQRLPDEVMKSLMSREYYVLAHPGKDSKNSETLTGLLE